MALAVGEDPRAQAVARLDPREVQALAYLEAQRDRGQGYPPIARDVSERMFRLFLRGMSPEDIRVLNPGYQLGQLVEARVRDEWDVRREDYDLNLVSDGEQAIRRAQLETALLAATTLSVAARVKRERLARYELTGDEKYLGDEDITTMRALAKNLELLLVATRQESLPGRVGGPPAAPPAEPPPVAAPPATQGTLIERAAARRQERLETMRTAQQRRRATR